MADNNETVEVVNEATGEIMEIKTPHKLVAETRDTLLRYRRSQRLGETWDKLSEADQRDEINAMEEFAYELVQKMVELIGEAGCTHVVTATLDKYASKDGVTTITAKGRSTDEAVLALNRIGKKMLKIIVLDADKFDEERPTVEPDPDQPDLLDEESEEQEQLGDDDLHSDDKDTLTSKEYKLGYSAYQDGKPDSDNPYDDDTPEAQEWDAGWDAAQLHDAVTEDDEPETEETPTEEEPEEPENPEPETEPAAPTTDDKTDEVEAKDEVDEDAYKTGQDMCFNEHAPEENPHDPDTVAHNSWLKGWNDMHATRQKCISEGREAKEGGKGPHHNPYDDGTPAHTYWDKGYSL